MPKIFRLPKNYTCPECSGVMKKAWFSSDFACKDCGHRERELELIADAMRKQGITPEQDWDDRL